MRKGRGIGGETRGMRRFLRAPVLCAGAVIASALLAPTMVEAFAHRSESLPVSLAARGALGSFTPASVDSRLVAQVPIRALANGRLFRFTPAGMDNRADRSVTVAVRLPEARGQMIAIHGAPIIAPGGSNPGLAAIRTQPIVYNLGLARGYQSFALPTPAIVRDMPRDPSEVRGFSLAQAPGAASGPLSRIEPRIALDERSSAGRAPRTLGTQSDYQVDMGGAYRVVGNLDVTAGVRYSSDRERLRPLTDHRQDSQAIYVGTQFRF